MDYPIHDCRDMLILKYNDSHEPSVEIINAAISSICGRLKSKRDRVLVIPPIFYSSREYGPIFRPDGVANFVFVQQIIGRMVRRQLTQNGHPVTDLEMPELKTGTRSDRDWRPRLIIIWIRQSAMEQLVDISIQLWLVLGDMPSFLLPLRATDKIFVVIENCSSRPHMWEERHAVADVIRLLRQNPEYESFILSPWAERLTRRPDDLDIIDHDLDFFGAKWYYRAFVEDDDSRTTTWCDSADMDNQRWLESALQDSVELGRQLAVYAKHNVMLSRILSAGRDHPTMVALKQLLDYTFRIHKVERVIIYCRVSPSFKLGANGTDIEEWSWSTERQVEILSRVVSDKYRARRGTLDIIRDTHKSAFSDMDRGFLAALEKSTKRACVIAVSLDRITRRSDHLSKLRTKMHETGQGHIGICLLWDHCTILSTLDSLDLDQHSTTSPEVIRWDELAQKMRQFTPNFHHHTLLQPVMWCPSSANKKLRHEEHVIRHVSDSEKFCLARLSPARCAPSDRKVQVPVQLAQTEVLAYGEYFSRQRGERWREFISNYLRIASSQIGFLYRLQKVSYSCRCQARKKCSVTDCDCNCAYCKTFMSCSCKSNQSCQCSEICSCACNHCHTSRSKRKQIVDNTVEENNTQIRDVAVASSNQISSALNPSPGQPELADLGTISSNDVVSAGPANPTAAVPAPKRRKGNLPSVCDRCHEKFRGKACSKTSPCTNCEKAGTPCTYTVRDAAIAAKNAISPTVRICCIEGCGSNTPGNTWKRCYRHEKEHKKARADQNGCLNAQCDNSRRVEIPWCSIACYLVCTPTPALCQNPEGCDLVVPPGLGSRCERHPFNGNWKANNYCTLRQLRKAHQGLPP